MPAGTDQSAKQLYEFGPFRVDPEKELLLRDDEVVPIAPKAFQVLLVLMRHSKQVVTSGLVKFPTQIAFGIGQDTLVDLSADDASSGCRAPDLASTGT